MKLNIIFISFLLPAISIAQSFQKVDTVISKDQADPNAEYWIIHNMQGNIKAQGRMLNQQKEGLWREYGDNGNMQKAEEYHNGMRDGASISFTWSGISSDETYKNGEKEGLQLLYNNSRIVTLENYHSGQLNGNRKLYYDDGKILKEESDWKNGKREGKTIWYNQGGKPSIEYTYVNGDMNGPAKTYNDSAKVASEGSYLSNDENGPWKYYDKAGNLEKTVIYQKGTVIKEIAAPKPKGGKK